MFHSSLAPAPAPTPTTPPTLHDYMRTAHQRSLRRDSVCFICCPSSAANYSHALVSGFTQDHFNCHRIRIAQGRSTRLLHTLQMGAQGELCFSISIIIIIIAAGVVVIIIVMVVLVMIMFLILLLFCPEGRSGMSDLSAYLCPSLSVSVCLSVCLPVCPSACLSV